MRICKERPVHEVQFAQPFALGVYAVTFDQYDRFARVSGRALPNDKSWGRERRPVINVSWDDATAYCEWLSEQTGQTYRLRPSVTTPSVFVSPGCFRRILGRY